MEIIQSTSYQVVFEDDFTSLNSFLADRRYSKVFFLVDENTEKHCLPILMESLELTDYDLIEVPAGEENKNIDFLYWHLADAD